MSNGSNSSGSSSEVSLAESLMDLSDNGGSSSSGSSGSEMTDIDVIRNELSFTIYHFILFVLFIDFCFVLFCLFSKEPKNMVFTELLDVILKHNILLEQRLRTARKEKVEKEKMICEGLMKEKFNVYYKYFGDMREKNNEKIDKEKKSLETKLGPLKGKNDKLSEIKMNDFTLKLHCLRVIIKENERKMGN